MPTWLETVRTWIVLLLTAFALNMIWEFVQLPLYGEAGRTAVDLPSRILYRAGMNDALLIGGAMLVALAVRPRSRAAFWLTLAATLAAVAVFIEVRAVTAGRWSYTDAMPTIGIVGLSPLVQLPLTGALTAVLVPPWRHGGA